MRSVAEKTDSPHEYCPLTEPEYLFCLAGCCFVSLRFTTRQFSVPHSAPDT